MDKGYYKYAKDVLDGKIIAGKYIQLACERFFSLMEDDRYEFREDKADEVIAFFSYLRHYKGRHANQPFVLEPWQEWIIANIYLSLIHI
mgnify:FL=1